MAGKRSEKEGVTQEEEKGRMLNKFIFSKLKYLTLYRLLIQLLFLRNKKSEM